ncbi:MAG: DEAD/DEAH box helicase [Thermomicrobiales bacterium]
MSDEVASFTDFRLSDQTLKALTGMGITVPTPIQSQALPILLDGRDVIGQARTGSGKTLAFGIPALENIDMAQRAVQVLVLTPTRELAVQVASVFEDLGRSRGIKVGLLFGGRAEGPQRMMLKQGVHVLVGTPGRVLDFLNQGALWLDKVRFLVLDEADEMLDRGFAPDVERILDRTTTARQTAMFSATVPDWVRKTADRHLHNPETVKVDPNPEDSAPIDHIAYDLGATDKMSVLRHLLDQQGDGSIIVFGRTKHGVKKLARQLEQAGYPVAALQGNLSQNARDQVMDEFRSGQVRILVATNVAARGLDISHVEQVINFELPESHQLLTHRIGRTGRMGRQGSAITLLNHEDAGKWKQLEKGLGLKIPRLRWQSTSFATTQGASAAPVEQAADAPRRQETRPARQTRAPQTERVDQRTSAAGDNGRQRPDRVRHEQKRPRKQPLDTVMTLDESAPTQSHPARERSADPLGSFLNKLSSGSSIAPAGPKPALAGNKPEETRKGKRSQDSQRPERQSRAKGPRVHITCAGCGADTTVPFEPDTSRPVYCRSCYASIRAGTPAPVSADRHDISSSGSETTYAE